MPLTYPSKLARRVMGRQDAKAQLRELADLIRFAVPPGPRKIPEGYDD